MDTPSHRITMPEPVKAVTTYTETPAQTVSEKITKKTVEPKKKEEDSPL